MKHDPEKKRESKGKEKGFATIQLSTTEFLGKRNPGRKESFREGNSPKLLRLSREYLCGQAYGKGWKKRKHSVVVAKTLDHTQAGKVTSLTFRVKSDFLHGVFVIPARSI